MTTLNDTVLTEDPDYRPEWIFDLHARPERPDFDFDVAIVGLGYVGLPTALAYHRAGSRVLALDISTQRLADIRDGRVDLIPADAERLARATGDQDFVLTDDSEMLGKAAAVVICVPTPVDEFLVPDLRILRAACELVVAHATGVSS